MLITHARSTLLLSLLCMFLSYSSSLLADSESDNLSNQKSQLEEEERRLSAELSSLEAQLSSKQRELDQLVQNEQKLLQEIALQASDEAAIDSQAESLRKTMVEIIASREAAQLKATAFEAEIKDLKIRESIERQKIDQITAEMDRLSKLNQGLQQEVDQQSKESDLLDQQLRAASEDLEQDRKFIEEELAANQYIEKLEVLKARWSALKNQGFDRKPGEIPQTAVGHLTTPQGSCTAFLVAPDRIRTAAHCVHGINALSNMSGYTFVAADETAVGILYQTRYSERADLIELKLKFNIELETVESASLIPELPLEMMSFDIMSGEMFNQVCGVLSYKKESGVIRTACESRLGMSGAPLFQNGKVVGYHVGKLDSQALAMVFEPQQGQEISDKDAAAIQYEYNCDSDCRTEISIPYPCPTIRRPGRICYKKSGTTDPICEAGKQQDCVFQAAKRETERALNRLKEELQNGINSLGIKTEQTKISINGLKKTFSDVSDAAMGRNQSVKDLQDRVLANAARIDRKRAELTQAALMLNEVKQITGWTLERVGASEKDIDQIKKFIDSAGSVQSKLVVDEKMLRDSLSALDLKKSSLAKTISQQKIDLDGIKSKLNKLQENGANNLKALAKKIGEMPEVLTVPVLGPISFDKEGKPKLIGALTNLGAYLDKKGPEIEKWIKARMKPAKVKHCSFDDVESQSKCLQKRRQQLEELSEQMKGLIDNFHRNVQNGLKRGGAQ